MSALLPGRCELCREERGDEKGGRRLVAKERKKQRERERDEERFFPSIKHEQIM